MSVCGADGVQRLVVHRDSWWVVEDRDTRECLSGGFRTRASARRADEAIGALPNPNDEHDGGGAT